MNHSSDIDFKDFIKMYRKCTAEPCSFLVNDATLVSDKKLQYNVNRKAAKISALSSNKFNKQEYLTKEETLPSNQKQMIEQVKVTYSP